MSRRPSRPMVALALLAGFTLSACADTVNPRVGGLRIGVQDAPLKPPERVDGTHPFEFPADAWAAGIGGTTVLRLLISTEGTVDSAVVLRSSGHPVLDSAALANARRLRYVPAEQGGQPVQVWGRLPVIYPTPQGDLGP